MSFDIPEHVLPIRALVKQFIEQEIYPVEHLFETDIPAVRRFRDIYETRDLSPIIVNSISFEAAFSGVADWREHEE